MIIDARTARDTAARLMQIKAIKMQADQPFTWASGWQSPIYCDNRISLSYPQTRSFLKNKLADAVRDLYPHAEAIIGVATGAIAIGALVAEALNLPFAYARPEPKKHGRKNQIEGFLEPSTKVLVIEDLISTGGSSLKVVDAVRNHGAEVLGMMALFTYAFPVAEENFRKANCQLHTLSDYPHLLEQLEDSQEFDQETLKLLSTWRENPAEWQAK